MAREIGLRELRRMRNEDEGESYYISMSDLMAGVLFLFIIMLTNFALQIRAAPPPAPKPKKVAVARPVTTKATPKAQALDFKTAPPPPTTGAPWSGPIAPPDARARALGALADYLHARGVNAGVDLGNGVLRLPDDLLFVDGGAAISPGGRNALSVLAAGMREILPCYAYTSALPTAADCPPADRRLGAVFVEGHTAGGGDAWGRSVQQASTVFQTLTQIEPRLMSLQNRPPQTPGAQAVLSVGGYGPSRPLTRDASDAGRRANSRVELRLVMAAP